MLYRAGGCSACNGTGYQGRIGVYEALRIDETARRQISAGADEAGLSASLIDGAGLAAAARAFTLAGTTTLEEAFRVTRLEVEAHGGV